MFRLRSNIACRHGLTAAPSARQRTEFTGRTRCLTRMTRPIRVSPPNIAGRDPAQPWLELDRTWDPDPAVVS